MHRQPLRAERRARHPHQAKGAEELDLLDLRLEDIAVAVLDRPRQHILRAQVELDRAADGTAAIDCGLALERLGADAHPTRRLPGRAQHIDAADEVGDERRGRLTIDLHRRADLLDLAAVHHDDAVGHRQRFFLIVRDHDRGHAELALQAADFLPQMHAHDRVERRQRLVEQQQPGFRRQRPRQRDALLLTAGELGRELPFAARQADELQQLGDPCRDFRMRPFPVDEAVGDVVRDIQIREQRIRLEDDAVVALGRRQQRNLAPGLPEPARALHFEPGDDAQERRLAAARGPEEADELSLGNF